METIRQVIEEMDRLVSRWDAARDHRAVFVRSYRMMTVRMEQAVAEGEFEDNAWMARLDVAFAREYFDAVEAYETGEGHLPACWRLTFEQAREKRTTVLQDLLLGMNAHVNHDLPIALAKLGLEAGLRARRQRDHERVDEVLKGMIDPIQAEIAGHYSWGLAFLDRLAGARDELVTDRGIRRARAQAWVEALALADAPSAERRRQLLVGLDARVTAAAHLLVPQGASVAALVRAIRRFDRKLALRFPLPGRRRAPP